MWNWFESIDLYPPSKKKKTELEAAQAELIAATQALGESTAELERTHAEFLSQQQQKQDDAAKKIKDMADAEKANLEDDAKQKTLDAAVTESAAGYNTVKVGSFIFGQCRSGVW